LTCVRSKVTGKRAQILFDASSTNRRISAYQAVLQKLPQLTLGNLQIGNAYRLTRNFDKGSAAYKEVLRSDRAASARASVLGGAYLEAGDVEPRPRCSAPGRVTVGRS